MEEGEFKKLNTAEVIKFDNDGDHATGKFIAIEESKKYAGSYGVTLEIDNTNKIVFVSNIVKDLIEKNSIMKGDIIRILYTGKKVSQDGKEYNTYELYKK